MSILFKNADVLVREDDGYNVLKSAYLGVSGEKIDYIVPAEGLSKQVFEEAFPNYDEYDGTSFIFRTGLGRKTLFVPGMTDYLTARPGQ